MKATKKYLKELKTWGNIVSSTFCFCFFKQCLIPSLLKIESLPYWSVRLTIGVQGQHIHSHYSAWLRAAHLMEASSARTFPKTSQLELWGRYLPLIGDFKLRGWVLDGQCLPLEERATSRPLGSSSFSGLSVTWTHKVSFFSKDSWSWTFAT